jgi:hypothetical protein
MSRAKSAATLDIIEGEKIIETRFCVTTKVTKTGPKHLGGGG